MDERLWCMACKLWLADWQMGRVEREEDGTRTHVRGTWLSPSMHVSLECGPVVKLPNFGTEAD